MGRVGVRERVPDARHQPHRRLNDDLLPIGATFFTALVEQELPTA